MSIHGDADASGATGKPRVLVADDDPVARELVVSLLRAEGCDVDDVPDGDKAVAACRQRTYDMVLLDGRMPRMNGLDTARAIRRLDGAKRVTIVGISGYSEFTRQTCLEAGMDDFLQKPTRRRDYVNLVAKWLTQNPSDSTVASNDH